MFILYPSFHPPVQPLTAVLAVNQSCSFNHLGGGERLLSPPKMKIGKRQSPPPSPQRKGAARAA